MRTVLLSALFLVTAIGCSSDRKILESDVFLPEDMVTIRSANIRRSSGELVGGDFFVAGRVNNAEESVDELVDYYQSNGWFLERQTPGLDFSRADLVKGDRTVTVELVRRRLDPANSTGTIVVATKSVANAPSPEVPMK
ncbi:MAG: hypothetical protein EXS10_04020 [Phycisphaerales bacterium]|nr:hypothetical protein [Phycisphaerales bacterium]